MKHQKWKVIQQTDISPSPWLPIVKDIVELPTGEHLEYFKAQLAPVSMVVPITKDNELIFVKQYKHGVAEICLEFPAGRIENSLSAEETAVKELQEETGIITTPDQLVPLIELWTEPSKSSVRVFGYLVTDVTLEGKQNLEITENIEVVRVPIVELSQLIRAGEIHASDTLALLCIAKEKFPELFR